MYPRLRGRAVIISGASAGFGEASARSFAANGSRLILGARRVERLASLAADIKTKHPDVKIHYAPLDVTKRESVKQFVASIPPDMSDVDILVNNAGLALGMAPVLEYDEKDLDIMLDTNVKGVVYMIKEILPGMISRNRGHIINISSVAGFQAYKNGSFYCASKHALEAITESLRKELIQTPIRVTSIAPGLAETEFSIVRFKGDASKAKAPYLGIEPLHAEDVADTISYVASRPDHVQIAELTILATHQASAEFIHREPTQK